MSATPRLSSADAAWLHMDRPTNLMVINSVLLFDEQLDWERFAEVVRRRMVERYPRFHQRVAEGRVALDGPHWREDPDFDLARHMHRRGLPAPGDEQALRDLAGDLAAMSLDRGKPLWDMYLIDGPGGGCAVIVRMHHCIADGIALAQVMLSLTDTAPEAEADVVPNGRDPHGRDPHGRSWPLALFEEGLRTLAHPRHAVDALFADAQALAKLVFTPRDAPSVLKRDAGAARSVSWSRPLSLQRVKAIAHAQGATVNDVLLAAVSGALRGYLADRGEEPHELRTLVPVNLRAPEEPIPHELGNRFGLVFLTLPVDLSSRRERLHELKRRMDEIKSSPQGPVSYAVLEAIGLTPPEIESRVIDIFTAKATAVMTNVPGPRETVYLAGSPLRAVLVWAPTAGSVGMSVSILSYDGTITVGLLVHAQLVPDPQAIVARLQRELAAMARLAPAANGKAA
ncbi:MAG: wax ester/triacylglycerol synthase family O-acyltransferase [Solirubrobacteraceae bacterium]